MHAKRNEVDGGRRHEASRPEPEHGQRDGTMSPTIRQLILSYGDPDRDGPWNAEAFTGKPASSAGRRAA